MPVTVVVGAQFGSEGKGKFCAHLAIADNIDYMVRCGGPNSGHTVEAQGVRRQLRQTPSGFVNPTTRLLIAPGALIDPNIFLAEVELFGLTPDRIAVDRNAGIIEPTDLVIEKVLDLNGRLGSTTTGVGSAVSRRTLREPNFRTAQDHPDLAPYLTSVREELGPAVTDDKSIVIEGTQGFGLSLYHADCWPYRTSRDTTAHSFLAETGLGVRNYEVLMAVRTHPIRVPGNSGPLPQEITWDDLQHESGSPDPIAEYTTVTNQLRRVAKFHWSIIDQAVAANCPTQIALHGTDYIDHDNRGATEWHHLSRRSQKFVAELAARTNTPVSLISTGPNQDNIIDLRPSEPSLR